MVNLKNLLTRNKKNIFLTLVVVAVAVGVAMYMRRRKRSAGVEPSMDMEQEGSGTKYVKELEGSFVLFSSSTCPHCIDMKPEWKKLEANNASNGVRVLNVEDDDETFAKAGVMGFPTMALFKDGKAIEYNGERKADAMSAFISKHA